jgi:hypothetical protein
LGAVVFDVKFEVVEFARGADVGATLVVLKFAVVRGPMSLGGIVDFNEGAGAPASCISTPLRRRMAPVNLWSAAVISHAPSPVVKESCEP